MLTFSKFVKPRATSLANLPIEVDVKDRVQQLTQQQLLEAADAYFAKFSVDSIQFKKPFSDPVQAIHLTQHLGLLFQAAELFRGARVLDFGCATGWLSLGMAQMGCDVLGLDVSPAAIRLADKLKSQRRAFSDGRMEFCTYDGITLPVADGVMDRIVCFDAFHHVRDQEATLREFARVLKPGGRIAFVEPGPYHSRTAASQEEMAKHHIIENDVDLSQIGHFCTQAGLNQPETLVQFQRPLQLSLAEFEAWARQGIKKKRAQEVLQRLLNTITDTQYFYVQKGQAQPDSRQASSLGGELKLQQLWRQELDGKPGVQLALELTNTGTGVWLTELGVLGQVKLGVQFLQPDGTLVDLDYQRINLPQEPVLPGQSLKLLVDLVLPSDSGFTFQLDLVSEHVSWFSAVRPGSAVRVPHTQILASEPKPQTGRPA